MRALQDNVTGITGTAVASRDGLIVRADTSGVDPDNLAAIAATWLALTQRLAREVGQGALREATARSTGGYVAVYAVGASAVLVVIGDEGLDLPRLQRESSAARDAIEALLSDPARASRLTRGHVNTGPSVSRATAPAPAALHAEQVLPVTASGQVGDAGQREQLAGR
jgi:predicted regulator of Ras-like GTPase activity (Roadblock/LC7/MglB family)